MVETMGTKNNPGKFDCYANAEPDEPMFVLLGRDPTAALVVTFWRAMRMQLCPDDARLALEHHKLEEARTCSLAMETWAREHGKGEAVEAALIAFKKLTVKPEP